MRQDAPVATYVINLERSSARWEGMQRLVTIGGFPAPLRFEGVDGHGLDLDALQRAGEVDLRSFDKARREGEIGCALSHVAVLRDIVRRRLPSALILEDDVALEGDPTTWQERYQRVLADLPVGWDIWYLNRCFDIRHRTKRVTSRLIRPWSPLCCAGYAVSAEGARKLLDVVVPVHDAIDRMYVDRAIRRGLVRAYAACPMLIVPGNHPSIIREGAPDEYVVDGVNRPPEYWPEDAYEYLGEPRWRTWKPERRHKMAATVALLLAIAAWVWLR